MNNLIQQELTGSHQYMLKKEVFSGKELIALTSENVAKVLAMLYTDSSYRNSMNSQNKESMAGCIVKLSNEIDRNNVKTDTISSVVKAINRDNRTHLNADKCGIKEITERLSKLTIEDWNVGLSGYNKKISNKETLIEYISKKHIQKKLTETESLIKDERIYRLQVSFVILCVFSGIITSLRAIIL